MSRLEDLFGLSGKVAVVTGASGGLGVELADALAGAGAEVAVIARRRDRVETVAKKLADEHGVRTLAVEADLTDRDATEHAFATIEDGLGPVDILVNNAGIAPTGRAEKQWPKDWDATMDLNLSALFQCSVLAATSMRAGGRHGRIINVTSIFGRLGSSLFRVAAYAASKGGAENLTKQLAVEWAVDGITVNAIAPAWFPSEMTEGGLAQGGIEEKMASGNPMGRIGESGELASACLFLAAPASSYVTGTTVLVDGGYSAW